MFSNTTVLDFIHGIKLALEKNKITSFGRILIKDSILKFVQSVDYFEEVSLIQEKFVILQGSFL
jgi:hypothetical protein